MKDEDYIKKAVELADRWFVTDANIVKATGISPFHIGSTHFAQATIDALAAQLVRQVDAIEAPKHPDRPSAFYSTPHECQVWMRGKVASVKTADDRTMNTIKAIIDSKVLE